VTPGQGIEDLTGPECYPGLVAGLERRGWNGEDVEAVTSANLLRFLRASL
jgi:microsomal dipeptidase-like Zn-dependent dipeptidase